MGTPSRVRLTRPRSQDGALKPASAVLSAGFRPLGSCPRAAGWSAATLCYGTKRTCRRSPRASSIEGRRDLAQMRAAQLPDAGEAPLSPLPRIEEGKRRHPAGVLVEDHGAGDRRLGAPLPTYDYHNDFGSVRVSIEGRGSPPILASN